MINHGDNVLANSDVILVRNAKSAPVEKSNDKRLGVFVQALADLLDVHWVSLPPDWPSVKGAEPKAWCRWQGASLRARRWRNQSPALCGKRRHLLSRQCPTVKSEAGELRGKEFVAGKIRIA